MGQSGDASVGEGAGWSENGGGSKDRMGGHGARLGNVPVEGSVFDEVAFLRAIAASGARALLLQNDETVDVLVARSVPTADGAWAVFDELWEGRQTAELVPGVPVALPSLEGLIVTKRIAARPKDLEDIRMLEALRSQGKTS